MAFVGRLEIFLRGVVVSLCLAAISLSLSSSAWAQLPVKLTTQEALPPGVSGVARANEPVTVGVPLADGQAISSTSQLGLGGVSAGQFRCLAKWPSGHCKWVELDYQVPSLGAGALSTAASLTTGTGNFGGGNLASDSNLASASSGFITVNTGSGGCSFTIQKAHFDVLHAVVCNGKTLVNGGSQGLVLMGPAYTGTAAGTTCAFNATCTSAYTSANDAASACSIEENGPLRAAVVCSGGLKDSSGNKYMGFKVRLHFYAGKERVKAVVTLKNGDDGAQGSFPASYKGYESFKLSLGTQLTGSNSFALAGDGSNIVSGSIAAGQSAYLYAGYSQQYVTDKGPNGTYDNYGSALQFGTQAQADAAQDITRSGCPSSCAYAQDGYVVVGTGGTVVLAGNDVVSAAGWADVRDSSSGVGITFGTDYMAANFPRSLEIRKEIGRAHV